MIHDKDYIIRIVKQFSEMIATLLLGKNEGFSIDNQLVFDTQMKDVFQMSSKEFFSRTIPEIVEFVDSKDESHHIVYYELLGNLFFYHFKENPNKDFAEKAKIFYELWLHKTQIYSISIMERIKELKNYLS